MEFIGKNETQESKVGDFSVTHRILSSQDLKPATFTIEVNSWRASWQDEGRLGSNQIPDQTHKATTASQIRGGQCSSL